MGAGTVADHYVIQKYGIVQLEKSNMETRAMLIFKAVFVFSLCLLHFYFFFGSLLRRKEKLSITYLLNTLR